MKIIAFIGFPLSGKSTATEVVKELGIPVVVMGDVVRDETVKRGLKLTNENLGKVANELRRKEGMDAIAKRCIPLIKQAASDKGVVVVDGIRGIAEVERFKEEFGEDFILIYIDAPSELRYKRALERQRSDDIKTVEDAYNYVMEMMRKKGVINRFDGNGFKARKKVMKNIDEKQTFSC